MNANDRKQIAIAVSLMQRAYAILDEVKSEEEDKIENMREKFDMTARFQEMEDQFQYLEEAVGALGDADAAIENSFDLVEVKADDLRKAVA